MRSECFQCSSFQSQMCQFETIIFPFANFKIDFETFREQSGEPLNTYDTQPLFNKVSKITSQYQERETALRIGMINKVVRNSEVNPCTDGSASCHPDSLCVPDDDSYRVIFEYY